MKNVTPQMVCEMAEWAVEKQLWAKRREDVLERLQLEAANGAEVFVASSVYHPIRWKLLPNSLAQRQLAPRSRFKQDS